MARVTAEEYVEKHVRRLKGSLDDVRKGIDRTSVAPGQLAAKQAGKMKIKVNEALDSGKWERNTSSVSLSDWQQAAKDKGVNRISQGIDASIQKNTLMAGKLLAAVDAASNKVRVMPSTTLEDNINRMTTYVREMSKAKIKG